MSTKGLRHHQVMNAYHHRWATRRAIGAAKQLNSKHAVMVPVRKGKRITKRSKTDIQQPSTSSSSSSSPVAGRGSFDSFFSQHFAEPPTSKSTSSSQSKPTTRASSINTTIYTPQLWTGELSHLSANKSDFSPHQDGLDDCDIELKPIHALFAPLGLPVGSIHNTISHIFLAENLWMKRYTNQPPKQELHDLWATQSPASAPHWSHFTSKIFQLPLIDVDSTSHIPLDEQYLNNLPSIFTDQDKEQILNNHATLHPSPTHSTNTSTNSQHNQTSPLHLIKILDLSLDEQDKLAQRMLSHLGLNLDAQCTDWIELIQGTSEPDLFNEISYFDSSYISPSRGDITRDDFVTDKSKLNTLQRLVALNHLFMHTTHHRSQIITAANQFTDESTTVDLTAFVPEWKNIHAKAFRWA